MINCFKCKFQKHTLTVYLCGVYMYLWRKKYNAFSKEKLREKTVAYTTDENAKDVTELRVGFDSEWQAS